MYYYCTLLSVYQKQKLPVVEQITMAILTFSILKVFPSSLRHAILAFVPLNIASSCTSSAMDWAWPRLKKHNQTKY